MKQRILSRLEVWGGGMLAFWAEWLCWLLRSCWSKLPPFGLLAHLLAKGTRGPFGVQVIKRTALCVNWYRDPGINGLQFAEADATELYAFFKRSAGYDEVRHLMAPEADQVLDCAREMAAGLEAGDLFVFFFAGHGYEFQGRHLLLSRKARVSRLHFFHQTVPVDLLKEETQQAGVDRVFVLDACRTDLLKDRGGASGLRGAQGLRDLLTAPCTNSTWSE